MKQLSLEPYARKEHPQTSHDAAADARERQESLRERALKLVEQYPGRCGSELDELDGSQSIHKILPYLVRGGIVEKCEPKISTVTGKRGATYRMIENE